MIEQHEAATATGVGRWAWQQWALCRGYPSEVFFPEAVRGRELHRREEEAKRICIDCPVLAECREHALRVPEAYGVWGALAPRERAQLAKRWSVATRKSPGKSHPAVRPPAPTSAAAWLRV
ncbi:WhiB family transcriptional regulator [Mycobacterium sp. NPDC003449]